MNSPFPGMDPYLEDPEIFGDLHDSLIFCLRETFNTSLPKPYFARIGSRIYVESSGRQIGPDVRMVQPHKHSSSTEEFAQGGLALATLAATEPVVIHVPQDEIRETFLEIYNKSGDQRLVATMEVLSPSNKSPGQGRDLYLKKQAEIMASKVHLLEIDLLCGGEHTTAVPGDFLQAKVGPFDYHVCIHQFDNAEDFFVYPTLLNQRLPVIRVPLLPGDQFVNVDLQALLNRCYQSGNYEGNIRYQDKVPPPPPCLPTRINGSRICCAKRASSKKITDHPDSTSSTCSRFAPAPRLPNFSSWPPTCTSDARSNT